MVALAMSTGIPVREWLAGDERALQTALDLIAEKHDRAPRSMRGARQMSG